MEDISAMTALSIHITLIRKFKKNVFGCVLVNTTLGMSDI